MLKQNEQEVLRAILHVVLSAYVPAVVARLANNHNIIIGPAVHIEIFINDKLYVYLARLENGSGFAVFSGRFQCDITFGVPIKHSEEIVIGAGHYDTEEQQRRTEGY